ncbi:MarR family winged helix-turn-helix transcriptional regulator [Salipiger thiooxidans]|jgi:DNA-binding MarR family transcriptional regulator|uniref:MarR family winged helix-turn-helix transcriptional regulator n=1 Tax=Salipiger thiooxidans TaxID=282683 RepID=UPI001A8C64E8|nr:MarR family transcriptional regulator [Salipiger thiooxidans]MBN8186908.1 MarR family transcriptional regulator [Salipiger thiooxidans]MBR9838289.1 MarR family transcriptional regulator [Paracoccaceae bacterium]MCA0846768.1 MarR family transcriptional regulator [Salipiger thiooxidans]
MSDFDKHRSAGYLANHMARVFAHALAERIRPLGLAPGQFMTLIELWREDGLTQRDLVARLDVEQATMANTLKRMERDGLITRRAHDSDSRARTIHLTEHARALQGPAEAAANAVNAQAMRGMSGAERSDFIRLMTQAIDSLKP